MEAKPKRPISVWIAQVMLVGFALLFIGGLSLIVVQMLSRGGTANVSPGFLVVLGIYLAIIVVLLFAFFGLAKRRQWGRGLAIAVLTVIWLLVLSGQFYRPHGPFQYAEYSNTTQWIAGLMMTILLLALLLAVPLALAFSSTVKAFFLQSNESHETEPPPPPIFNE